MVRGDGTNSAFIGFIVGNFAESGFVWTFSQQSAPQTNTLLGALSLEEIDVVAEEKIVEEVNVRLGIWLVKFRGCR